MCTEINPWPIIKADSNTTCAALFMDIRSSTLFSRNRAFDSSTIATLTRVFVQEVQRLYERDRPSLPTPAVRSFGDGLFCVWELTPDAPDYRGAKRTLLDTVLAMSAELGPSIQRQWQLAPAIDIGMGLSFGDALRATYGSQNYQRDYYGYSVNLAAKLQALARPNGVIISGDYYEHEEDWNKHQELKNVRLPISALQDEYSCYVTEAIWRDLQFQRRRWTCLAWPGFAKTYTTPSPSSGSPARIGLTQRGVTVITHEGINGKISTLQIWPRNQNSIDHGDRFEIIIDDYDGLGAMVEQGTIALIEANDVGTGMQLSRIKEISKGLRAAVNRPVEHERKAAKGSFFFLPLRCGLNAYAWNTESCSLERAETYEEILLSESLRDHLALYDNPGASMPVLLSCIKEKLTNAGKPFTDEDVFNATAEQCAFLEEYLHQCQGERHKLFHLYDTIKDLSNSLELGNVKAVLGGGAWLIDDGADIQPVRSRRPAREKAFLWIEGASILKTAVGEGQKADEYIQFLRESLLRDEYQSLLPVAEPYGATPVCTEAIVRLIAQAPGTDHGLATQPTSRSNSTNLETAEIFKDCRELRDAVRVRRTPTHLAAWNDCWIRIRKQFCH